MTHLQIAVFAFAIAQVLDIITTVAGLQSSRVRETNPVIRWAMARFGSGWRIVKLALATGIAAGLAVVDQAVWLWPVTALTLWVAWHNWRLTR